MKTKNLFHVLTAALVLGCLGQQVSAAKTLSGDAPAGRQPLVQIALLLDTSNSMDGLIDQAKSQLWKVVNEFINAKQDGRRPEVQVALFEYGKQSLPRGSGFIRQIVPLTTDLDKISEELFNLRTNGGEEYCGWVIQEAVAKLAWSNGKDVYKAIFIAGNEPFTQGPVDYRVSCKDAIERGIIVNTIHCGNAATGLSGEWQKGAHLAEGKYMSIDQNRVVAHISAPQDKDISRLGVELNKTYLAYGTAGKDAARRQQVQDANAEVFSSQGSSVSRAVTKSSGNYRNSAWDLVDACKEKAVKLEALKLEELPVEMQKMTETERKSFVETKAAERAKIQAEINRLNAERNKYVAEQSKNQPGSSTLDTVMVSTIREQAARRNYKFD